MVEGSAAEVVARSGLITFVGTGEGLSEAAARRSTGAGRRVGWRCSARRSGSAAPIAPRWSRPSLRWRDPPELTWVEEPPSLEDVFIHLLSDRRFAA